MGVLAKPELPPGANPDWTIPQGFERYGEAEHRTWTTLYERQAADTARAGLRRISAWARRPRSARPRHPRFRGN